VQVVLFASEVRLRKAVEMGLGSAMAENLKYAVSINRTKERKPKDSVSGVTSESVPARVVCSS